MTGGECEVCGRDEGGAWWSLVEHHVSYFPEETMMVCKSCHSTIHDSSDELSEYEPDNPRPYRYSTYPKDVPAQEWKESEIFHPWKRNSVEETPRYEAERE